MDLGPGVGSAYGPGSGPGSGRGPGSELKSNEFPVGFLELLIETLKKQCACCSFQSRVVSHLA